MGRAAAYAGPAETGLEPDDDAAYRFLSWWFKDCNKGVVELCWTGASGQPTEFRRFDDIGQLVRIACELNEAPGVNVYIRAATIALSLDERRHTTDADVALLPGCWADCDDAAAAARAMDCTLAHSSRRRLAAPRSFPWSACTTSRLTFRKHLPRHRRTLPATCAT
jgi:hypothetical protein